MLTMPRFDTRFRYQSAVIGLTQEFGGPGKEMPILSLPVPAIIVAHELSGFPVSQLSGVTAFRYHGVKAPQIVSSGVVSFSGANVVRQKCNSRAVCDA